MTALGAGSAFPECGNRKSDPHHALLAIEPQHIHCRDASQGHAMSQSSAFAEQRPSSAVPRSSLDNSIGKEARLCYEKQV
jgi:hypothetical protein